MCTWRPTARVGYVPFVHGEGFDEVNGVFVSDPEAKRLRFDGAGKSLFDVSFEQLTAIHYEESKYPPRIFRRSALSHHPLYEHDGGSSVCHLSAAQRCGVDASGTAVRSDTGMTLETRPATTSFLGLPLRVGPGDTIIVTDNRGQTCSRWADHKNNVHDARRGSGESFRCGVHPTDSTCRRPGLEWGRLGRRPRRRSNTRNPWLGMREQQ